MKVFNILGERKYDEKTIPVPFLTAIHFSLAELVIADKNGQLSILHTSTGVKLSDVNVGKSQTI